MRYPHYKGYKVYCEGGGLGKKSSDDTEKVRAHWGQNTILSNWSWR